MTRRKREELTNEGKMAAWKRKKIGTGAKENSINLSSERRDELKMLGAPAPLIYLFVSR